MDAELHGCPISPEQLREVLVSVAVGRRPQIREEAVCLECKRRGTVCVMVAQGLPCLGPVTQSGCGALCPTFGRGCYGCFGPREQANAASLARTFGSGRARGRGGQPPVRGVHRLVRPVPRRDRRRTAARPGMTPYRHVTGDDGGRPCTATDGGTLVVDAPGDEHEFKVGYITRVEGEGSLSLRVRDGEVVEARLRIFEAPRYFERLVVGRTGDEVIDIVARICGICPIAYQMTAVHAFEDLYGVEVDPSVRALRRLLYCGEYDPEPRAPRVPAARAGLPRLPVGPRDGGGPPRGRGAGPRDQDAWATS